MGTGTTNLGKIDAPSQIRKRVRDFMSFLLSCLLQSGHLWRWQMELRCFTHFVCANASGFLASRNWTLHGCWVGSDRSILFTNRICKPCISCLSLFCAVRLLSLHSLLLRRDDACPGCGMWRRLCVCIFLWIVGGLRCRILRWIVGSICPPCSGGV